MPPLQSPIPSVTPGAGHRTTSFHRQACDEWPAGGQPQLQPFVATAVPTDTTLKTRVRYPEHACSASEVSGVVNIPTLWAVRCLLVIRRVIFGELGP